MENIYTREERMIRKAEGLLSSKSFSSSTDAELYQELLEEYRTLFKQMKRIVRMSDMVQSEMKTVSDKLDLMSRMDVLTELYNRRYFNENYLREWNSAVRSHTPLSLLMIDIDYFKNYNDTYGHIRGDECLKEIAVVLRGSVQRPRDFAARFGGEEFVILLPETDNRGALLIAWKVLTGIRNLKIPHAASPLGQTVSVSIGVASAYPTPGECCQSSMDALLQDGDTALYRAKRDGRNCIREFRDSSFPDGTGHGTLPVQGVHPDA